MLFHNCKGLKRWFASASTALVLAAGPGVLPQACAQEKKDEIQELRQRLEALEKQNSALLKKLDEPQPAILLDRAGAVAPAAAVPADDLKKVVEGYLAEHDAKAKAADAVKKADAEAAGFAVGSMFGASVRWAEDVNGFKLETANKDFTAHVGGRLQYDTVFWHEDPFLKKPTQIGDLQDGAFFRRVRIQMDGTAYEVIEYNFEYALENSQQGIVGLDEFWAGITKIPLIGTVRIGHQKVPQGLEGDMVSSSKSMTFMERASFTDAFYNNFAAGIWAGNNLFDQRATWSSMFYRTEKNLNAADFGDGEYAASARATFLPLYENEGRCLIHVGVSGTWREAEKAGNHLAGPRLIQFSARPEMRDAAGDFGSDPGLPGNSKRLVDTGAITADAALVLGTELLAIYGPASLQAEWAFANATNATAAGETVGFNGGYVQASYFLTGEHRQYDRRLGRLSSTYVRPYTNFWAVRDEDGRINLGRGAWEIAARYSYLNLNDGDIRGGVLQGQTIGLNWYLNPNFKVQFQYLNDARWHRNGASPPGNNSGDVNGFGIRTQLFF